MSDSNFKDVEPDEHHVGRSDYQLASQAYYGQLRNVHTGVYSSTQRMQDEKSKKRYTNVRPAELEAKIQNLGSFITLLHELCGGGPAVRGVDFGCGSHWFIDFVRNDPSYDWSAVGYDADEHAIELARQRFPQSADSYRFLDPLRSALPEGDETQHFVFSNAVLQHLDDREIDQVLAEMSRVLRPGGLCMLIFKCWTDEIATDASGMDEAPQVLDAAAGKVLYFDPTMKDEIDKLSPTQRDALEAHTRDGWRLFHVLRVEQIMEIADRHSLNVAPDILPDEARQIPGVITYRSGKKMPTACIVFTKPQRDLEE